MQRKLTPELMDDPAVDPAELDHALGYIRGVNRWLGGQAALLGHLRAWSGRWPRGGTITLLDVATGSADLPIAARRWGLKAGFDLRVTGVDVHETTLELARRHVAGVEPEVGAGITLVQADARRLMDHFKSGSFDYVHAGLFLHHLPEIDVLTVLRIMDRLSRAGVVWNDLRRSRLSYAFITLATLGQPEMVRHDARVSVLAGFTRGEAMGLARRVDLDAYCRWRFNIFTGRFTVAGEKSEAW